MLGIDTDHDVSRSVEKITQAGIAAVGRHYSRHPSKRLSAAEAQKISRAGPYVWTVYEDGAHAGDFTAAAGREHALRALDHAGQVIRQPTGSAIYFAVDYNADAKAAAGNIREYFEAASETFAAQQAPYRVGVYSSGAVCGYLLTEKLVALAWLSQSRKFFGHAKFYASKRWSIAQGMPPSPVAHLNADPDELAEDYGGFSIPDSGTTLIA